MKLDEHYIKPSKHKQWQEKTERPIAQREMTPAEIEEHRMNLVRSYKCDNNDIKYIFVKIKDENDEDRDDCLLINYMIRCSATNDEEWRTIFTMKVPMPEEVKRKAEQIRREQARSGMKTPLTKPVRPARR